MKKTRTNYLTPQRLSPQQIREETLSDELAQQTAAVNFSWDEAVEDFLLQVKATREEKTVLYYTCRLTLLMRWAKENGVPLATFRARDLRQYLAARAELNVSDATRRHDAVAARAFLKFCKREGVRRRRPAFRISNI